VASAINSTLGTKMRLTLPILDRCLGRRLRPGE
jgi:hypothetical protein